MKIQHISALEILDSRGFPTLEVAVAAEGRMAQASVPSGKSTGRFEALERRDGDPARFCGKGVLGAVGTVNKEIAEALVGQDLSSQAAVDRILIDLDGTPTKTRLGANAILGVSLACARLRAALEDVPLYRSLGGEEANLLPVPCFNVINGGAHSANSLEWQEFMIVPAGLPTFAEALRAGAETYHKLAKILENKGLSTSVGDEGGFAPEITHPQEALDLLMEAIEGAGYRPGDDVCIALDPAASGFYQGGVYAFAGERMNAKDMTALFTSWLTRYPILSIEDGLAESDWDGWTHFTREIGDRVQLVGDDIFVSDPTRVRHAMTSGMANAVLLKPNQVGTLSEVITTAKVAQAGRFRCMMSHRSGETPDDFIADLAVALGVGQIKSGAPARGERVAKYNQLLRIERALGAKARFAGRAAFGK